MITRTTIWDLFSSPNHFRTIHSPTQPLDTTNLPHSCPRATNQQLGPGLDHMLMHCLVEVAMLPPPILQFLLRTTTLRPLTLTSRQQNRPCRFGTMEGCLRHLYPPRKPCHPICRNRHLTRKSLALVYRRILTICTMDTATIINSTPPTQHQTSTDITPMHRRHLQASRSDMEAFHRQPHPGNRRPHRTCPNRPTRQLALACHHISTISTLVLATRRKKCIPSPPMPHRQQNTEKKTQVHQQTRPLAVLGKKPHTCRSPTAPLLDQVCLRTLITFDSHA